MSHPKILLITRMSSDKDKYEFRYYDISQTMC